MDQERGIGYVYVALTSLYWSHVLYGNPVCWRRLSPCLYLLCSIFESALHLSIWTCVAFSLAIGQSPIVCLQEGDLSWIFCLYAFVVWLSSHSVLPHFLCVCVCVSTSQGTYIAVRERIELHAFTCLLSAVSHQYCCLIGCQSPCIENLSLDPKAISH